MGAEWVQLRSGLHFSSNYLSERILSLFPVWAELISSGFLFVFGFFFCLFCFLLFFCCFVFERAQSHAGVFLWSHLHLHKKHQHRC